MTSLLLLLAMLCAACGLALSIVVNAVSFTSLQLGGNALFPLLTWGIFPAFLSVILISILEREGKMRRGAGEEIDHWELVFAGCPSLMKYIFWVCFAYAGAIGMVLAILQTHEPNVIWRGVSAFWGHSMRWALRRLRAPISAAARLERREGRWLSFLNVGDLSCTFAADLPICAGLNPSLSEPP